MAQTGPPIDPYRNFSFLVEFSDGGVAQADFIECTGIVEATPGCPDITLKWGLTGSAELWDWHRQTAEGVVTRRNGSIVVADLADRTEVVRWNFVGAWPTRWEGPAVDARGNDIAIDTLVLSHEGLTRA